MAILLRIKCDNCGKKREIGDIEDYTAHDIRHGINGATAIYEDKPLVITTWYDKDARKLRDNHFCCYECKRDYDERIAKGLCMTQI